MTIVVVEGWRSSCHSYALVNQRQLLQLQQEPRLQLFHRDVPLYRESWTTVDSGLTNAEKARLADIVQPPPDLEPDVTFRISYPFRMHAGRGRILVFATNELDATLSEDCVGADGSPRSARPECVEIVTPSYWSRRAFLAAGHAAERIHVLPHGVDPSLSVPMSTEERRVLRNQLRIPEDSFAFLHVGAMSWNKGVGPLIAAFAVHRMSFPKSILILKGGDALYGNVLRTCCAEAIRLRPEARHDSVVRNLRYIRVNLPSSGIARLYRAADAYISTYRAEGFNLPVLEAMASDLPVIVTRGGSTDDFCPNDTCLKVAADITTGPAGTHLEPRIDDIVEQMARMVEDAGLREQLSHRARTHVLPAYSWAGVARRLTDVFCQQNGARPPAIDSR